MRYCMESSLLFQSTPLGTNPRPERGCWPSLLMLLQRETPVSCISWAEGCSFAHIFWFNRIHSHSASSRTCPELGPTIKGTGQVRLLQGAGQSSKTSKSSKTSARGTHPESSDLRERAQRHQLGDLFLSCSPFPYVTWFMGS